MKYLSGSWLANGQVEAEEAVEEEAAAASDPPLHRVPKKAEKGWVVYLINWKQLKKKEMNVSLVKKIHKKLIVLEHAKKAWKHIAKVLLPSRADREGKTCPDFCFGRGGNRIRRFTS